MVRRRNRTFLTEEKLDRGFSKKGIMPLYNFINYRVKKLALSFDNDFFYNE